MSYQIIPFENSFGAKILLFDASKRLNNEIRDEILSTLFKYQLLIFKSQNLSVSQQVAFTELLGDLERPWNATNTHPENSKLQIVSNVSRKNVNFKTSSEHWHTDRSFVEMPPLVTLLHVQQIPDIGGFTEFVDMKKSYEEFSQSVKQKIDMLFGVHSYNYKFLGLRERRIGAVRTKTEEINYQDVLHPLVRQHPVTGEKSLFLSELCLSNIFEMDIDESDKLLQELYSQVLAPKYIYRHQWEKGDFMVWDNASLMHRAVEIPEQQNRILHRTAIQSV